MAGHTSYKKETHERSSVNCWGKTKSRLKTNYEYNWLSTHLNKPFAPESPNTTTSRVTCMKNLMAGLIVIDRGDDELRRLNLNCSPPDPPTFMICCGVLLHPPFILSVTRHPWFGTRLPNKINSKSMGQTWIRDLHQPRSHVFHMLVNIGRNFRWIHSLSQNARLYKDL